MTCKGRLHHLQKTLPAVVAEAPNEIVVVDYGCPDRSADWVQAHFPAVRVVRVNDDPGFCVARARNIGATNCISPWLCFIDADVIVREGFVDWIRSNADARFYYLGDSFGDPTAGEMGTVLVNRTSFDGIDGYDECFRGWGGEDYDLYFRLSLQGICRTTFPPFVAAMEHDDAERLRFYRIHDRKVHGIINSFYVAAKMHIMSVRGSDMRIPAEDRRKLMDEIVQQVTAWSENPGVKPRVSIEVAAVGWLPRPFALSKASTFTLTLTERPA
jgi:glycosyltransferase involved in cell wall biosynthesis